jgi:S1-C subfamily serine protease
MKTMSQTNYDDNNMALPNRQSSIYNGEQPDLYDNSVPYATPADTIHSSEENLPETPAPFAAIPGNTKQRPPRGKMPRSTALFSLALITATVFGVGIFAGWQYGSQNQATSNTSASTQLQTVQVVNSDGSTETQQESVIAKTSPGIVQITVQTSQGSDLGSGVIIDKNGYIVTNNHVVNGASTVTVQLANGTTINNANVVATDSVDDLAVVKIPTSSKLTVVPIGDSSKLSVGQTVYAIGNPLGNTQTVTHGIISALNRTVSEGSGAAAIPDAIQTDAPINPGNSGGALINTQGQLIGIPTLSAVDPETNTEANGVGFAISSNRVQNIVNQVIQTGKITHTGRAGLNISTTSVNQQTQLQYGLAVSQGALLTNVTQNGAAAKAGLQAGDIIVQVDNTTITDSTTLQEYLLTRQPGQKVTIKAYVGSQLQTFTATLNELQA